MVRVPGNGKLALGDSILPARQPRCVHELPQIPAAVRFISAEPLLGSGDDLNLIGIHWRISRGESEPGFRGEAS